MSYNVSSYEVKYILGPVVRKGFCKYCMMIPAITQCLINDSFCYLNNPESADKQFYMKSLFVVDICHVLYIIR